jgi:hypothetical protein
VKEAGRVFLGLIGAIAISAIVWDQVETRALARDIDAIAARGEPTTVDAIAAGGDTPERYDAARIYHAAAERVRQLPPEVTFRLERTDVDSTVTVANLDQLERTYRPDSAAMQLLDQATPLDFNGFGDVGRENEQWLGPLANLACVRADVLSARGHGDKAAGALVASVRLWRTVPIPFRSQVSSRVLGSLRILLRHTQPAEPALAALQKALADLPDADALVTDVQYRRARFIDAIDAPRPSLTEALARRALRPYIARSNRRQLEMFKEALAVAAQPWPAKLAAGRDIERRYAEAFRSMNRRGFFARLASPPGIAFAALALTPAARDLAARRVSIATLAVERYRRANHGANPASLDALVPAYLVAVPIDPFSGSPLAYRVTGTGYRLYSVDTDAKDDGGVLYGIGSKVQLMPQQQAPRDLGIEVLTSR